MELKRNFWLCWFNLVYSGFWHYLYRLVFMNLTVTNLPHTWLSICIAQIMAKMWKPLDLKPCSCICHKFSVIQLQINTKMSFKWLRDLEKWFKVTQSRSTWKFHPRPQHVKISCLYDNVIRNNNNNNNNSNKNNSIHQGVGEY